MRVDVTIFCPITNNNQQYLKKKKQVMLMTLDYSILDKAIFKIKNYISLILVRI